MEPFDPRTVRAAYDAAAADYVAAFADDLDKLPLDRSVLDAALEMLGPGGGGRRPRVRPRAGLPVPGRPGGPADRTGSRPRDAGPGRPGGPEASSFAGGDMRALPFGSAGLFAAAVAFYSIQHLPEVELPSVLGEIRRVLAPGGILVIATHLGDGEVTVDEFLGHAIEPVGGTFYGSEELEAVLRRHSFRVDRSWYRDPLPHEHPSKRIYLIGRRDDG